MGWTSADTETNQLVAGVPINALTAANLSQTPAPTGVAINIDAGTDITLGLATATNAGLLAPKVIHPSSPGATMPATSNQVGELFFRTGATNPGVYVSLDLLGSWTGPLS